MVVLGILSIFRRHMKALSNTIVIVIKCTYHTEAKSSFLSKNSIFMESFPTINMNFCGKNEFIQSNFLNKKLRFATVCSSLYIDCMYFFVNYRIRRFL